ncbi:hypothetical protein H4582DRAFT_2114355 [Lactarius indigo]|nr:hypothetical protein H4582DRAFT_2114355 [Lactarius indigo]
MHCCPYPGCRSTFRSQHGRTYHFRKHNRDPVVDRVVSSPYLLGQRKEHPHLTALPCDKDGNFLPPGAPPQPREGAPEGDWSPFKNEVQFQLADLVYCRAKLSATNINSLLHLWAQSMSQFDAPAPFESHEDLYALIDSSALGDVPWQCLLTTAPEGVDEGTPSWMRKTYEVWYRNPDTVLSAMLSNSEFRGQFDLQLYINLNANGTRRWSDVMSGNIAWRHCNDIFMADPSTEGAMYCPIILGSDKTIVLVMTGHVEYHPLYLLIGNLHNTVRRAHRNAVIPIVFLAIPKCDRWNDGCSKFRVFNPLHLGMTTPVVRRCPDGHFRRVIYDLFTFIADYPEQAMLTGIIQGWCPKCTARPPNLDTHAIRRTPRHTEVVRDLLDSRTLWAQYGIDDSTVPFTFDFPCADIYEMISPDLLHQIIKGVFKDHLVAWVCEYLVAQHGERRGGLILDDIDRRISAVPPFPGLRRFPEGRHFKQWTGDDSKALMKVYIPAIVGYVPDDVILCLGAFMDACYISRRQDIDSGALDALDRALEKFKQLREVFRTSDFGAPGGLCTSITESHHITAVKKPWCRSNRFQALGQMLLTNQRLDKLAAMRSHFTSLNITSQAPYPPHLLSDNNNNNNNNDDDNDNGRPVEEGILGHVVLAQNRAPKYPSDIEGLSRHIGEPNLHYLTRECVSLQLGVIVDEVPPLHCRISVFHSAVATFFSPSDPCGTQGMRRERIRSTPSWRGCEPRRDLQLLFSFVYEDVHYPCALVEWFTRVGCDPLTGLWVVHPDITHGRRDRTVVHLDSFLWAAHLIPVFGNEPMPLDLHYTYVDK